MAVSFLPPVVRYDEQILRPVDVLGGEDAPAAIGRDEGVPVFAGVVALFELLPFGQRGQNAL